MWLTIAIIWCIALLLCSCSAYEERAWDMTCQQAIKEKAEPADDLERTDTLLSDPFNMTSESMLKAHRERIETKIDVLREVTKTRCGLIRECYQGGCGIA